VGECGVKQIGLPRSARGEQAKHLRLVRRVQIQIPCWCMAVAMDVVDPSVLVLGVLTLLYTSARVIK
jgi:hypothetical protein